MTIICDRLFFHYKTNRIKLGGKGAC